MEKLKKIQNKNIKYLQLLYNFKIDSLNRIEK